MATSDVDVRSQFLNRLQDDHVRIQVQEIALVEGCCVRRELGTMHSKRLDLT